jgi:hypothetical protein
MANEFDKNKDEQQDPQQKRDQGQGQGQSQDIGNKKNPNQDIQDRNREGSEDVEKRRAS